MPNLIWLDLFHEAIENDHIAVAKLMWEYVDCNLFFSAKERADFLCAAVACESQTHIEWLLDDKLLRDTKWIPTKFSCYKVDYTIFCGPLELAAKTGNEKIVTKLLEEGVTCTQNPLLLAILEGHEHIVKLLLDHGDQPGPIRYLPCPALGLAIEHEAIFKLLLERGAGPLIIMSQKTEPVMLTAITHGNTAVFQELLNCGVPIEIPQPVQYYSDQTAPKSVLHYAIHGGPSMLEYLLTKGIMNLPSQPEETEFALTYALRWKEVRSLKFLLDQGLIVPEEQVPTILSRLTHWACNVGSSNAPVADEIFTMLLSRGVDINARDHSGCSAIWYSRESDRIGTIVYLLEKGADSLLEVDDGTPLCFMVCECPDEFWRGLNAIDIQAVPKAELQTKINSCLTVAVRQNQWDVVKQLERFQVNINNQFGGG